MPEYVWFRFVSLIWEGFYLQLKCLPVAEIITESVFLFILELLAFVIKWNVQLEVSSIPKTTVKSEGNAITVYLLFVYFLLTQPFSFQRAQLDDQVIKAVMY